MHTTVVLSLIRYMNDSKARLKLSVVRHTKKCYPPPSLFSFFFFASSFNAPSAEVLDISNWSLLLSSFSLLLLLLFLFYFILGSAQREVE